MSSVTEIQRAARQWNTVKNGRPINHRYINQMQQARNAALELAPAPPPPTPAAAPTREVDDTPRLYNALSSESKRLFWTVPAAARFILLHVPHLTVTLEPEPAAPAAAPFDIGSGNDW